MRCQFKRRMGRGRQDGNLRSHIIVSHMVDANLCKKLCINHEPPPITTWNLQFSTSIFDHWVGVFDINWITRQPGLSYQATHSVSCATDLPPGTHHFCTPPNLATLCYRTFDGSNYELRCAWPNYWAHRLRLHRVCSNQAPKVWLCIRRAPAINHYARLLWTKSLVCWCSASYTAVCLSWNEQAKW